MKIETDYHNTEDGKVNRRLQERHDISEKLTIQQLSQSKGLHSIGGTSVDISEAGVGVELKCSDLKQPFSLGESVQINVPSSDEWISATVAWCNFKINGSRSMRLGLEITDDITLATQASPIRTLLHTSLDYISAKLDKPAIRSKTRIGKCEQLADEIKKFNDAMALIASEVATSKSFPRFVTQERINRLCTTMFAQLTQLSSSIRPARIAYEELKDQFRKLVEPWVLSSKIMKRALEKPRGYPGDFMMLEWVYDAQPLSAGLGHYFDRYFLFDPYAVAVRNRKNLMRLIVLDQASKAANTPIEVLNIGCGSCREIREIATEHPIEKNLSFHCIDSDREAISYSRDKLVSTALNEHVVFSEESIIELIKAPKLYSQKLGQYDLVYSIGLIDYFQDRTLKRMIHFLYSLVKPGGALVLTHKDRDEYKPTPAEWFCDWQFVPRNGDELRIVTEAAIGADVPIRVIREESGCIFFFLITKPS